MLTDIEKPRLQSLDINKKIQILNWFTGSVIFEHEQENNTLKDTLVEAVKKRVNLSYADLSGVDLRGADLSGADLSHADLSHADLCEADFHKANIRDAVLRGANLSGADLGNVDIRGAVLIGAYIRGAKNVPNIPLACPSEGAFIGWKVVDNFLVELEIPEDARRSSATTSKCRCNKAKVLTITDLNGKNPIAEIENTNYAPLTYKVGEMVYPDYFDDDRWNECSHGIHFFVNKQDAINYSWLF